MLASGALRRIIGAVTASALLYALVVAMISQPAGAPEVRSGAYIMNYNVMLTNTAAADYNPQPGSSPGLAIFSGNQGLRNAIVACGGTVSCEKTALQNGNIKNDDTTIIIEPAYSQSTDFQVMSGTALPVGFRFATRGGRPGAPGQNPVNLSGAPDAGTATARVCWDGIFLILSAGCKWARAMSTGLGYKNCPGWTNGEVPAYGTNAGEGPAHISMITNDAGPVNRTWGPVPPGGYTDPKGQLWDVWRQRYAYARMAIWACASIDIGGIAGTQHFEIAMPAFIYKDEPVVGATSMLLHGDDHRTGGNPQLWKSCGSVTSTPPNPCNSIYELAFKFQTFSSSKRMARVHNVCGQTTARMVFSNSNTSAPTTMVGGQQVTGGGYPSCPPALTGRLDTGSNGPLGGASVYAFDSSTGAVILSPGAAGGGTTASAAQVCRGGNVTADAGVPAGPAPGTATASYGCDTTVGNTGNSAVPGSPRFGDGRYFIGVPTSGTSVKLFFSTAGGDGWLSRWYGGAAPNSWSSATSFTVSTGGEPRKVGDTIDTTLTNTIVAAPAITGDIQLNGGNPGSGYDGAGASLSVFQDPSGTVEMTSVMARGDGTFSVDSPVGSKKIRYEASDGAGNPNLVEWHLDKLNWNLADVIAHGAGGTALPANNLLSGANISGTFTNGSSSYVDIFRASDGQLMYYTPMSAGAWNVRVAAATCPTGYKVFSEAPNGFQEKWYNLKDNWTLADCVTAPTSGNNMTLPASGAMQGYVKSGGTDIDGAYVYAFTTAGVFVGQDYSGSQGSGRYRIDLNSGTSYKLKAQGTSSYEDKWYSGAFNFGDASSTAAPATVNFDLRAAGNVSGTATQLGSPIAAQVTGYTTGGTNTATTVANGVTGAYTLKLPSTAVSGWNYRLRFDPPAGQSRWYLDQTNFGSATNVAAPSSGINQDCPP